MAGEAGADRGHWGTSNRRVFQLDGDGAVLSQRSDTFGVLSVSDFPAEIAALRAKAGDCPLLLAGMVGSNRGWIEVPYVEAPAGLAEVAAGIARPLPGVAIVPGVVQRDAAAPDIMRGEEVQLIGADICAGLKQAPGPVTLIGTPDLCRRFALALQRTGRPSVVIDGTAAFVAGAHAFGDQQ